MTFTEIKPTVEFLQAMMPLCSEWAETCEIDLDINWTIYSGLIDAGLLASYVVNDGAGKVVGFALFTTCPSLRQKHRNRAQLEVLYLMPEYRKGLTGYKFIKFCETKLVGLGCSDIVFSVLDAFNYSKVLEFAGYKKLEILYRKKVA